MILLTHNEWQVNQSVFMKNQIKIVFGLGVELNG